MMWKLETEEASLDCYLRDLPRYVKPLSFQGTTHTLGNYRIHGSSPSTLLYS